MEVVIIGTGNVATVLGGLFKSAGCLIVQVFGRNAVRAKQLAEELDATPCSKWEDIDRRAGLYLVAISDKALYGLEEQLQLSGQLIVHTAGSVSREVLKNVSANYGVLYPLQSMRKQFAVPRIIPFLVDASNESSMQILLAMAGRLSSSVMRANDEERLRLHLAAVLVNNFTNHLYAVAADYCLQENVSFRLLLPIIAETADRLHSLSPADTMTGPAVRNDAVTINRHLEVLESYPHLRKLYAQLTESIQAFVKGER